MTTCRHCGNSLFHNQKTHPDEWELAGDLDFCSSKCVADYLEKTDIILKTFEKERAEKANQPLQSEPPVQPLFTDEETMKELERQYQQRYEEKVNVLVGLFSQLAQVHQDIIKSLQNTIKNGE